MIGIKWLSAACMVGLALVAPGALAAQAGTGEGADIYARTCGRCHNARSPLERSDREWSVIMLHMRVRAGLTGKDARAVRDFLVAMNRQEGAGPPAGGLAAAEAAAPVELPATVNAALVEEGRALADQFACGACHAYSGSGTGTLGPPLNGIVQRRSADYVARKLADPRFDNPDSQMPQLPLTPAQRRALLEFLRTLR